MELEFSGEVWWWKGPAPFHFVTVPQDESVEIEAAAELVTYGWGMIPVEVHLGTSRWRTALWPKDDRFVVPLKAVVRTAEEIELGDTVTVRLSIEV